MPGSVQQCADPPGTAACVEYRRTGHDYCVDESGLAAQVGAFCGEPTKAVNEPLRVVLGRLSCPPGRRCHQRLSFLRRNVRSQSQTPCPWNSFAGEVILTPTRETRRSPARSAPADRA